MFTGKSGHWDQWPVYGAGLGCVLPLTGCRVPLNLSLFFHRVGLSPKPGRPAWDEGLRHVQTQGSAQRDSLSVQHGPVLAKPGPDGLAVFPPHHSLRVLLSVLQPQKPKPSSSQAEGPTVLVGLGSEPAHHPYRPRRQRLSPAVLGALWRRAPDVLLPEGAPTQGPKH